MNAREAARKSIWAGTMMTMLAGGVTRGLAADAAVESIPFQMAGHLMIVRASIGEETELNFAIDTGASFTVLSRDLAKRLGIKGQKTKVSTWGRETEAQQATVPELALGTVRFSDVEVRILELPASQGVRLDGLIGLDLLRRMPVTIDFHSQTIQFGAVPPLRHSQSFYSRFPFIPLNLTVNGEVLRVVVDTGAAGLMLYGKAIRDRFQFPRNGSTETWPHAGGRVKMDPVLVQGLSIGETPCSDLAARVIRDGESGNPLVMGNLGIQSLGLGSIQLDLQAGRLGWEE